MKYKQRINIAGMSDDDDMPVTQRIMGWKESSSINDTFQPIRLWVITGKKIADDSQSQQKSTNMRITHILKYFKRRYLFSRMEFYSTYFMYVYKLNDEVRDHINCLYREHISPYIVT